MLRRALGLSRDLGVGALRRRLQARTWTWSGDSLRLLAMCLLLALVGSAGSPGGGPFGHWSGACEENREAAESEAPFSEGEAGGERGGESESKAGSGARLSAKADESAAPSRRKRRIPLPRLVRSRLVPAARRVARPRAPEPLVAESFSIGRASVRGVYLHI